MSVVLLIAIPLLAAFISILGKKFAPYLLLIVGIFNFVFLFFLKDGLVIIGGFNQPLGINLLLDTYSRIALLLINGLIVIITALNLGKYNKYASVLLLSMASLNGLVLTNDLFNLFV